MTHELFLPLAKSDGDDWDMPFHWLCWSRSEKTLKGDFTHDTTASGTILSFTEEEDKQLFILMWGEYL